VSPIIGTSPVRGMADKVLAAIGVESTASAVATHFGARTNGGVLDGWLVDTSDDAQLGAITAAGIHAQAVPLWMSDLETTAAIADAALNLAEAVRR
jgi:LPPG:FO 2-phospho-L-lactate transferase